MPKILTWIKLSQMPRNPQSGEVNFKAKVDTNTCAIFRAPSAEINRCSRATTMSHKIAFAFSFTAITRGATFESSM